MKKIGIITFHRAYNYGAYLQVYALSKVINAFVIDYSDKKLYRNYRLIRPFRKNIIKYLHNLIEDIKYYRMNKKRKISFEQFINNRLPLIPFNEGLTECDMIIVGSDQVWNPNITQGISDVYTLNIPNIRMKVSYAASLGNSKLDDKYKNKIKKNLSSFDYISVRENTGKEILMDILPKKKIEVTLDPVLLLTKEQWDEEIVSTGDILLNEKYILAYVVEPNDEYRKIVNYVSKKENLKVVHFEKKDSYDNVLYNAYTCNPFQFIKLIKNAEYIITTSFHATIFSIIYNKKFWIIPHKQTASRVTDLLKKFNISNRDVKTLEEFKKVNYRENIDYTKINDILENERKKSINWLKKVTNRK